MLVGAEGRAAGYGIDIGLDLVPVLAECIKIAIELDFEHVLVELLLRHLVPVVRDVEVFGAEADCFQNGRSRYAHQRHRIAALDVLRRVDGLVPRVLRHEDESFRFQAALCFHAVFEVSEILPRHLHPPLNEVLLDARFVPQQLSLANQVILRTRAQLERKLFLFFDHFFVEWVSNSSAIQTLLQSLKVDVFAFFLCVNYVRVERFLGSQFAEGAH